MGYYITPSNSYYEGDKGHALDVEVPQRPSYLYDWNGAAWVINAALQAAKDRRDADETERQAAKQDSAILALVDATQAQLLNYVNSNFPSLATQGERNKFALILSMLAVALRDKVR
tara:strand:- start:60 stop:407 length:348 start_codon:yes stop_codon:yes gene_type:complete